MSTYLIPCNILGAGFLVLCVVGWIAEKIIDVLTDMALCRNEAMQSI